QYDRDGTERLGEAARPGRLLADAAARKRDRLVPKSCFLPPDANLNEHEVGTVQGAVEVARQLEIAGKAGTVEHPRRQPSDDLQPRRVDILEDELTHVQALPLAREATDQLRGVGRATADDCDLHPFTPVSVTPST